MPVLRRRLLAGAAAIVALTLGSIHATTPAHAIENKTRCGFLTIIAVRGSNEPAGIGSGASSYIYGYGGYGSGDTAGGVARFMKSDANIPVYNEALKYPASILPWDNADAKNYLSSEQEGTRNLKSEMNGLASRCPDTITQLVGYSQGAHVIGNVLQAPSGLSAAAKANLRGVALFADPTYRAGEPWDATGNGGGNGRFVRDKGAFNAWTGWSTTSASKVNMVRSYCLSNDYFCQSAPGESAQTVHGSYGKNSDLQFKAYLWLKSFVTSAG